MTKRLDVSTLTLTVKPVTDNANKFTRIMNGAILRGWLILNLFALLRQAQRIAEKIEDDSTSVQSISIQLAIQTRIRKPVQVTQELRKASSIVKPVVDLNGNVVAQAAFDKGGNVVAMSQKDINPLDGKPITQETGPIISVPTMEGTR